MKTTALLFLVTALAAIPAIAQGSAELTGHIDRVEGGLSLAGASVRLTHSESGKMMGGYTNAKGRYRIKRLEAGTYTIRVSMVWIFRAAIPASVRMRTGASAEIGSAREC